MDRFWLLTWTTYGTWLPGDARGFVSELRDEDWHKYLPNQPQTEYPRDLPGLQRYASSQMKGEPIWLLHEQAAVVVGQFRETATYRGWALLAAAVMANHCHLVVGVPGDPDPSTMLGDFKEYGSRALNRRYGKPQSGTWWTGGGSKRKLATEKRRCGVVAYVRDQYRPLLVWLNEPALQVAFGAEAAARLVAPASGDRQVAGESKPEEPAT